MHPSIWSIGCALVGGAVYFLWIIFKHKQPPKLNQFVISALGGAGILAGIKVCKICVDAKVTGITDEDRLYFFLGGLAVIWASVSSIGDMLKRTPHGENPAPNQPAQKGQKKAGHH